MEERVLLQSNCSLYWVSTEEELDSFSCGDVELDDFFHQEACLYDGQLLGKTYFFSTKRGGKDERRACCTSMARTVSNSCTLQKNWKKKQTISLPKTLWSQEWCISICWAIYDNSAHFPLLIGASLVSRKETEDAPYLYVEAALHRARMFRVLPCLPCSPKERKICVLREICGS